MAERASAATASGGISIDSSAAALRTTLAICSTVGRWKSKRWQRSTTVAGTLFASVVASTNTVFGGGSSSVFRNAFHAAVESMCASSRMYTLRRPLTGAYATLSRSSRMSSTELFDAASISITSSDVARAIDTHESHTPHGSIVGPCSQFRHAARIFAIDVLPVPREPTNRYAWCTLPRSTALRSVRTTGSWPTTSANVRGRCLR